MKELIEIQSNLKAPKGQYNSFGKYKYRNCEDVLEALKPLLKEQNCYLILNDIVEHIGGSLMIKATATITNAEEKSITVSAYAGIDVNKKGMDVSQCFGASSSYARKYALNGLFAIDDTKDADSAEPPKTPVKPTVTAPTLTMDFESDSFIKCKNTFIDTPKEGEQAFIEKLKKHYSNSAELIDKITKLKIANKL